MSKNHCFYCFSGFWRILLKSHGPWGLDRGLETKMSEICQKVVVFGPKVVFFGPKVVVFWVFIDFRKMPFWHLPWGLVRGFDNDHFFMKNTTFRSPHFGPLKTRLLDTTETPLGQHRRHHWASTGDTTGPEMPKIDQKMPKIDQKCRKSTRNDPEMPKIDHWPYLLYLAVLGCTQWTRTHTTGYH